MRMVEMWFLEQMSSYVVTFLENGKPVGRQWKYLESSRLHEILRAGHAPIEDHSMLDQCLVQRRSGHFKLRLDEEQYKTLRSGRGRRGAAR